MTRLVVDAGPLIALFYLPDAYHHQAVRGMEQLEGERVNLIVPLPILFEVYKFLLYRSNRALADEGLVALRHSVRIVALDTSDLDLLL